MLQLSLSPRRHEYDASEYVGRSVRTRYNGRGGERQDWQSWLIVVVVEHTTTLVVESMCRLERD